MKRTIETTIEINAAPEKVWSILCDFNSYGSWNPFVQSIAGDVKEGQVIKVTLTPPGGGTFAFKPVVRKINFPEFRWLGKLLFKGLFDGEHYFRVEAISSNKTRLIHGENFSGLLVGALGGTLEKTKAGFQLMNEALKKKAEQ